VKTIVIAIVITIVIYIYLQYVCVCVCVQYNILLLYNLFAYTLSSHSIPRARCAARRRDRYSRNDSRVTTLRNVFIDVETPLSLFVILENFHSHRPGPVLRTRVIILQKIAAANYSGFGSNRSTRYI